MNPFIPVTGFAQQVPTTTRRETSVRRPPKKVLNILENFCPQNDDLTTTLFLGDLSVICDEVRLYELFSRFGAVETVQLKKSDRDPQRAHLGFGFIKFVTRDSAERALQEMNGYFFLGRAMRVGWAVDYGKQQTQSLEKATDPKKSQTAQIHVMFVTRELNRRVSELDLGAVFGRFGNLVDIAIKKNAINSEHGVQSGYAFLHFALTPEGLKSAIAAVEQVNNLAFDNIAYQCKVTHTLQAQFLSMNYPDEEAGGMRNLPRPLSHSVPGGVIDSSFQSYEPAHRSNSHTPSARPFEVDSLRQQQPFIHTPPLSNLNSPVLSNSGYHEKGFHSYGMNVASPLLGRSEPSSLYEGVTAQHLNHHRLNPLNPLENEYITTTSSTTTPTTFSQQFYQKNSDISMNSIAARQDSITFHNNNNNNNSNSSVSPQYYSNDHHRHPFTLDHSSSSSFVSSSTYEDHFRRRGMIINPSITPPPPPPPSSAMTTYDSFQQQPSHHNLDNLDAPPRF